MESGLVLVLVLVLVEGVGWRGGGGGIGGEVIVSGVCVLEKVGVSALLVRIGVVSGGGCLPMVC